jgi:hypothetical protein
MSNCNDCIKEIIDKTKDTDKKNKKELIAKQIEEAKDIALKKRNTDAQTMFEPLYTEVNKKDVIEKTQSTDIAMPNNLISNNGVENQLDNISTTTNNEVLMPEEPQKTQQQVQQSPVVLQNKTMYDFKGSSMTNDDLKNIKNYEVRNGEDWSKSINNIKLQEQKAINSGANQTTMPIKLNKNVNVSDEKTKLNKKAFVFGGEKKNMIENNNAGAIKQNDNTKKYDLKGDENNCNEQDMDGKSKANTIKEQKSELIFPKEQRFKRDEGAVVLNAEYEMLDTLESDNTNDANYTIESQNNSTDSADNNMKNVEQQAEPETKAYTLKNNDNTKKVKTRKEFIDDIDKVFIFTGSEKKATNNVNDNVDNDEKVSTTTGKKDNETIILNNYENIFKPEKQSETTHKQSKEEKTFNDIEKLYIFTGSE